jgi:hypothetical protein
MNACPDCGCDPGCALDCPSRPQNKPENFSPHANVSDFWKTCTCLKDTQVTCPVHPFREEIDYTKAALPETVCEEANRIVYGDREQTYGHPALNFEATARYWNAYLDNKKALGKPATIDARDVARMMVFLKMARQQHAPKRDNLVDAIGYTACEAKIDDYEA